MLPARGLPLDRRLSDACRRSVSPRDGPPEPADGERRSDGTRNEPTSMSSTSSRCAGRAEARRAMSNERVEGGRAKEGDASGVGSAVGPPGEVPP
jgi:hypothetical protein